MKKRQLSTMIYLLLALFFVENSFGTSYLVDEDNCVNEKQGRIWYFGQNAGLDFNTSPPKPLTNGKIVTFESAAIVSDEHGNLLFYTDGITVWDKNQRIMPNGRELAGHPSSTHSAIAIQQPSNPHIYYIFTVDYRQDTDGLRYSIVDLTLNEGFGDVITASKNKLLLRNSTEKLAAIKHCNGKDYWIVGHEYDSNAFVCYLLSDSGLSTMPVISKVGTSHTNGTHNQIGYMKVAPSGNKIALAVFRQNLFEILDFDKSTAMLSNPLSLNSPDYYEAYGVEFSPDETKLYATKLAKPAKLFQFDLTAGDAAAINASVTTLHTTEQRYVYSGLQLGIDGKLYVSLSNVTDVGYMPQPKIGVINFPNNLGTACDYTHNSIPIGGSSRLGLPNILHDVFFDKQPNITGDTIVCIGEEITYTVATEGRCDVSDYHFTYSGNAVIKSQTGNTITLLFTNEGSNTLHMTKKTNCSTYYDEIIIQTDPSCCQAKAGVLSATNRHCTTRPIITTTNNEEGRGTHQLLPDYKFAYLLIDASSDMIIDIQTNSTNNTAIFKPNSGNYLVCSYNESVANPPIPSPLATSLGSLENDHIGGRYAGCFDKNCHKVCVSSPREIEHIELPDWIQTYPNPFFKQINILYKIENKQIISLNIFDITGKNVHTIIDKQIQEAGSYQYNWNAKQIPAGVYHYRLEIGNNVYSDKIVKF